MSVADFGGLDLIKQFANSLVKKQVGIEEFCESDEFCNKPLYPRQKVLLKMMFLEELTGYEEDVVSEWIKSTEEGGEVIIAPMIRERRDILLEKSYDHFTTVQLVMGRRAGKGYMTGAAIAKRIYDLIQLEDPAKHFGVARGENIYFAIAADSQDQAKKYQFKDARNWILDCTPLQEYVGQALAESISIYTPADIKRVDALRDKRVNADKALASIRVEAFAKNARTIRGNASILICFDEMAHITPGESHISDEELFKAAEPALAQFDKHAMIFANSSPYQKLGKFYELYTQSLALDGNEPVYPTQLMIQCPSWEMYKDWEKDHKWSKAVIFSPDEDKPESYELRLKEKANPESFKVEYRGQFAEVIDAFLVPEKVDEMFDPDIAYALLHKRLENKPSGNIEHSYKAHGDPSATGANFGFAVGHVEMVQELTQSGQLINAPHVVFDLIDAFYPEDFEDKTIDWLEIMPVFINYINDFRPFEFTFDQFNSNAPIQMLQEEARRIGAWETNVFVKPGTVPQNRRRANNFKAALNLGRVHAPHPNTSNAIRNSLELGRNELKFLQEKGGRIEKQSIGPVQTKDIADCIMEVVDVLIGESLMAEMDLLGQQMQFGAQQGYSLTRDPVRSIQNDPFDAFYSGRDRVGTYNPAQGIRRKRRGRW